MLDSSSSLSSFEGLSTQHIQEYLSTYSQALSLKTKSSSSSSRSSTTTLSCSSLIDLDCWYESLPFLQQTSDLDQSIKSIDELDKLIRWKLCREKYRPTLVSLLHTNSPYKCKTILSKASSFLLSSCPNDDEARLQVVEKTMKILSDLKGIGPVTSSAIVATWSPYGIFQSDELSLVLLGNNVKINYTWPFYTTFYRIAIKWIKFWSINARQLEKVAWSIIHSTSSTSLSKQHISSIQQSNKSENKNASKKTKTPIPPSIKPTLPQPVQAETSYPPRRTSKRLRST